MLNVFKLHIKDITTRLIYDILVFLLPTLNIFSKTLIRI